MNKSYAVDMARETKNGQEGVSIGVWIDSASYTASKDKIAAFLRDIVEQQTTANDNEKPERKIVRVQGNHRWSTKSTLTEEKIYFMALEHKVAHGKFPTSMSAEKASDGSSWMAISTALRTGARRLPGGGTLSELIWRMSPVGSVPKPKKRAHLRPRPHGIRWSTKCTLSEAMIVEMAVEEKEKNGSLPTRTNKNITRTGDTWMAIHMALKAGVRGLPGHDSLTRLLARNDGLL